MLLAPAGLPGALAENGTGCATGRLVLRCEKIDALAGQSERLGRGALPECSRRWQVAGRVKISGDVVGPVMDPESWDALRQ